MTNPDYAYDGRTIYHYCNLGAMKGILDTNALWATHMGDLADETEMEYGRGLLVTKMQNPGPDVVLEPHRELLNRWANATRALPDISELIRRMDLEPQYEKTMADWYVICFSDLDDALPL